MTNRSRRPAGSSRRTDLHVPDGVRLQKVLASAGIGSRRVCEEYIQEGRVEVNGSVVTELGVRVDPANSVIHVDGMRVNLNPELVTIALNKPSGVVSTMFDPEGRPSLADFVADRTDRLFHVGRLDIETEGLILLTNDGELANRLMHPAHGVPKTYVATVEGKIARGLGRQLSEGIELEDGVVRVDSFRVVDSTPRFSMVEIVIHEGRHHIVRRLLEASGHPVTKLVRTRIGPITLGSLKPGRFRVLGQSELNNLMTDVGM